MRLHVVVRGRVQGVGFRWFVRERATELNLAGWVKNRADGCVEVEAEGDASAIARLRDALREGPHGASVSSVDDLAAPGESRESRVSESLSRPFSIAR
jgi:acylphosphatase